jgi:hypothetical protein
MYALRLLKLRLNFLSPTARGPQRRSKTIGRSTQLIGKIAKIAKIVDIMETTTNSPRIRKRSGVRSIVH